MFLLPFLLLTSVVHASGWFSSEPDYAKWSHEELRTWLEHHNVKVPASFDKSHVCGLVDANWQSLSSGYAEHGRQWSLDQYNRAQRAFQHIKEDSFDKWDESKLRAFLLEQGVIAPTGPREQLILLAKNRYRTYTDAAALYSSLVSGSISSVYASATDATNFASHCISTAVAQATDEVARVFDDTRDYAYSSWDDNQLRSWLQDNGVIEAKNARSKDQLTGLADAYYRKAASAVWESWSDSYIREWLIAHNLLKPSDSSSRSSLLGEMRKYYYQCTDKVWNTWTDSELKSWLVGHKFMKSDAQKSHDDLVKMVEEYYFSVPDNVWGAWTDSDIRQWLSEYGYLEGGNNLKRERLVVLINNEYPSATQKLASYLVWPDARLRAYLREMGISENALPTHRPGLLQETRIRWVQSSTGTETAYEKLKEIINSSVEAVEEKIARAVEVLSGHARDVARYASENVNGARGCADGKKSHVGKDSADKARGGAGEAGRFAQEKGDGAVRRASQWLREKVQGASDEL